LRPNFFSPGGGFDLADRAGGDVERMQMLTARVAMLAVVRLRRGGNLPSDRRAWFRALARLAGED